MRAGGLLAPQVLEWDVGLPREGSWQHLAAEPWPSTPLSARPAPGTWTRLGDRSPWGTAVLLGTRSPRSSPESPFLLPVSSVVPPHPINCDA